MSCGGTAASGVVAVGLGAKLRRVCESCITVVTIGPSYVKVVFVLDKAPTVAPTVGVPPTVQWLTPPLDSRVAVGVGSSCLISMEGVGEGGRVSGDLTSILMHCASTSKSSTGSLLMGGKMTRPPAS